MAVTIKELNKVVAYFEPEKNSLASLSWDDIYFIVKNGEIIHDYDYIEKSFKTESAIKRYYAAYELCCWALTHKFYQEVEQNK